ncbi:MAG: ActS/PrrB/RegB family redox-sensitive histidine kinase [Bauldia sp.]|nr:ActS/PrrB/RegB family redox-sensitive histidine kinase [Bauldia sp.]
MAALASPSAAFSQSPIKLDTLIGLRWVAIAGQTAAILVVGVFLGYPMPVGACFALTAASAWLNLFLKLRYPATHRVSDNQAAALLAYDSLQLTGLLYLTGGLENPFALLLLVPVLVSASSLAMRYTLGLGLLTIATTTILWQYHLPLPWPDEPALDIRMPLLYVGGIWLANLSALAFAAIYMFRVTSESRKLANALAATELVLEREHHISQLDGLAAAAAHELGTPLATITVVAKELQKELDPASPQAADVRLLAGQAERCREILGRLKSLSGETDWTRDNKPLTHFLTDAAAPYTDLDADVRITAATQVGPEPVGRHNPATLYGIGNLIENAVDFARNTVEITASWTPATVTVEIADDGPGFAPEVIDRIGEPYVTTRAAPDEPGKPDHEAGGLGLGFFIAKTFLERSGAKLRLANRPLPRTGAIVTITWPRAAYEASAGRGDTRPQVGSGGNRAYKQPKGRPELAEPAE